MTDSTSKVQMKRRKEDSGYMFLRTWETWLTRIGLTVGLMICAFLAGLAMSWTTVRAYRDEQSDMKRRADLTNIQMELAAATLNAHEGRFEEARQNAGNFFRELRARYDTDDALQQPEIRENVRTILSRRDEVMFLLGSKEAGAAHILRDGFFKLRGIMPPPAAADDSGG